MTRLKSNPMQQRGIATILILILTGLSLTAAVLGATYYIRSTQEVQMSQHSLTQAQMKAWTGAELIKGYIEAMTPTQLRALAAAINTTPNLPITFSGVNDITAIFTSVDSPTNPTVLTAQITGLSASGTRGQSASVIESTFAVTLGTDPIPANNTPTRGVVMFKKGLAISGDIKLFEGDTKDLEVIVDGNVTTSGSMSGVDIIRSTGDVDIGSTGSYDLIHANGKVTISNSAKIKQLWSWKSAVSPASIEVDMVNGNAQADVIKSNGNVSIKSSAQMGEIKATGLLSWSGDPHVSAGTVSGLKQAASANVKVNIDPAYQANVPMVDMTPDQKFDAYTYESLANYVFKVDATGFRKVTVKNVSGISDGIYFLGNFSYNWNNDNEDYLCLELAAGATVNKPMCKNDTDKAAFLAAKTICKSADDRNASQCFSYDKTKNLWNVSTNGNAQIAQGVAWFEGNLNVNGSKGFYNAFIATGNITTSGNVVTYAPNFAGFDGGTYSGGSTSISFTGICTNTVFPSIYPKQFCEEADKPGVKVSKDKYQTEVNGGIGNFAYLAGSVVAEYTCASDASKKCTYKGGDINLGASNYNYGSVWAGNLYGNGGNTNVYGYITALALGDTGSTNSIKGGTTINLKQLPTTYTPGKTLGGSPPTAGTPGTPNTAKRRWSRYL